MSKRTKTDITKNVTYMVDRKQTGDISGGYTKVETDAKFKDVNNVLLGVILILLVMVATLIIDSFHINSATYREYSKKIQTLDSIQNTNKTLFEQNNQNQVIIIEQQRQIIEDLNIK